MAVKGKRVIFVGPADDANHKPLTTEAVTGDAFTLPGMVMQVNGSTLALEQADTLATVKGLPFLIADKDSMRQKTVDDVWIQSENMVALIGRPGEFFNVQVITAQVLKAGLTPLTRSTTPGALRIALTDGTEQIVAIANESLTTSGTQLVQVAPAVSGG